jgi:hypothetical protein
VAFGALASAAGALAEEVGGLAARWAAAAMPALQQNAAIVEHVITVNKWTARILRVGCIEYGRKVILSCID